MIYRKRGSAGPHINLEMKRGRRIAKAAKFEFIVESGESEVNRKSSRS